MSSSARSHHLASAALAWTGIPGLDDVLAGGLTAKRLYLLTGVAGLAMHDMVAEGEQIIAAPTLIKKLPLPLRRFIGDMSHTEKILLGLDLRQERIEPE